MLRLNALRSVQPESRLLKGMVSSQSPSVLPVAHVTLHAPVLVVTDVLGSPQATPYAEVSRLDFEAPQHSPPELYTLHSSLLI